MADTVIESEICMAIPERISALERSVANKQAEQEAAIFVDLHEPEGCEDFAPDLNRKILLVRKGVRRIIGETEGEFRYRMAYEGETIRESTVGEYMDSLIKKIAESQLDIDGAIAPHE